MKLTPQELKTKQTYDKIAADWSSIHMQKGFWKEEMDALQKLLPKGHILEIGAGGGRDATELIQRGFDYYGTDISGKLLDQARKNNPGVSFEQMSVYDLKFDLEFDGFWCAAVLLHIPKKHIGIALGSINAAIKPGGIGFISVKEGVGEKMEDNTGFYKGERFFAYWSADEFVTELESAGFTVIEQGYKPMNEKTKWLTFIVRKR